MDRKRENPLFREDMIVYENSTKFTKKILQLKSKFSKVTEYKVRIQKSNVLVCNERFDIELKSRKKFNDWSLINLVNLIYFFPFSMSLKHLDRI